MRTLPAKDTANVTRETRNTTAVTAAGFNCADHLSPPAKFSGRSFLAAIAAPSTANPRIMVAVLLFSIPYFRLTGSMTARKIVISNKIRDRKSVV